jgi:uncharacterized protein (TIRG00374 family)
MEARPVSRRLKQILVASASLAISGLFLYFAFREISLADLSREITKVNLPILLSSLGTLLVGLMVASLRGKAMLAPLGPLPFARLVKAQLLLFAANNVLPFRMGELLRVHYLARHGRWSHSSCLAVAATERLLDLGCILVMLAGLVLFLQALPLASSAYIVAAAVVISIAGLVVVSRRPKKFVALFGVIAGVFGQRVKRAVVPKLELFASGLAALSSARVIALVALLSGAYWLCQLGTVAVLIAAWGLRLPWYAPITVLLYLALGTALPSSPGYVGTYHYFSALALARFDVPRYVALSFAVVSHAMAVVPYTVAAVLVLFRDQLRGEIVSWRAMLRGTDDDGD